MISKLMEYILGGPIYLLHILSGLPTGGIGLLGWILVIYVDVLYISAIVEMFALKYFFQLSFRHLYPAAATIPQ